MNTTIKREAIDHVTGRTGVVLKLNNCVTNAPCALCGQRTDPRGGLDYMLAGTTALVCDTCAERHAPGLQLLVGRSQQGDEADPVTDMVVYFAEYDEAAVARILAAVGRRGDVTEEPRREKVDAARLDAAEAVARYVLDVLTRQLDQDLVVWDYCEDNGPGNRGEMTQPEDWLALFVRKVSSRDETVRRAAKDESYFGCCPVCHMAGAGHDIGKGNWMACDRDRIAWYIGSISSIADDPEEAARNAERLRGYRIIDASEAKWPPF